ncbi:MAG: outer membrane protein assembly factor BamA [Treponema sp.]|nr:outer membrane protein assembly factor BamA [Treponema sp.]
MNKNSFHLVCILSALFSFFPLVCQEVASQESITENSSTLLEEEDSSIEGVGNELAESKEEQDDGWYWGKVIADISFDGLKKVKRSELNGIVSTFTGQAFTESVYIDMADRIDALDLFDDFEPLVNKNPRNPNSILLIFSVKEKPVVSSLSFSGNRRVRNGELRETTSVKVDDIYVEAKVLLDERAIRDLYLKKGYTDVSVSHTSEETEQGVKITFIINEGANTVISSIRFSGNTVFSERTLKSKLTLKEVGFMKDGAFQRSTLETDKQVLAQYYQDRGYADVRITDVLQESTYNAEKARTELTLTFIIQEGICYSYGGTEVTGNKIFPSSRILSYIKLKEGDVFNQTKYQEGLQGITELYAESGYMTNQYVPTIQKDTEQKKVSFTLEIVENARSHIENIIIKGNTKTKEHVIRREIPLEPGDVFSRDKVMQGLRNLYNLQYFSSVIPEPMPGSEADLVDLVINVEEQSTMTLEFGMTFAGVSDASQFPLSLFARWQNSNLRGEGRTISAGTTISNTEQSVNLSYGQNWIKEWPIAISESISFSHSHENSLRNTVLKDGTINTSQYYMTYRALSFGLSSSVGRRWDPTFAILTVNGGISFSLNRNLYKESQNIPRDNAVSQFANRWGFSNSLWGSVSLDNRDINYDPSKGWFLSERLAWFGLIPGLEREFFLRSDTKLEGYVTLFNIPIKERWAFKAVLAAYTGITAIVPVPGSSFTDSSKVYVDGMFNGRGWGEVSENEKRGKFMLSNRLELRLPVVPNILGLTGFFDMVALKTDQKLSKDDLYFSFGPGLRILLPQFPLHLLWAWTFKHDGFYGGNGKPARGQFVLSFNMINR